MVNELNQRLLYDTECNGCNYNSMCECANTLQCCRKITDKLRSELGNNRKHREIVAKIVISTEYIYTNYKLLKRIADKGSFVLREPYIFAEPFSRAEITGEHNGGTFTTKNYGW